MNISKVNKFKAIGLLSLSSLFLRDCDHVKPVQPPPYSQLQGKVLRVHVPFKPEKGWTKFTPIRTIRFSDGGKEYVYNINGATVYSPMPPNGFNPLTATKSELEQYGFPTPPNKSQQIAYESWVKFVSSMDIVDNAAQYQTQDYNEAPCGIYCPASGSFNNDSGYIADMSPTYPPDTYPPTRTYIQKITAEYTQVAAHKTPCSNPAESTWIGFGGYSSISYQPVQGLPGAGYPLAQVGSEVQPGGAIVPFYEYLSVNNFNKAIALAIPDSPGNKMSAYMAYIPNKNELAFILSNQSVTYKNGGHPTVVKIMSNAVDPTNKNNSYFYPYGGSVTIEAPQINNGIPGLGGYSGRRPMVDFGTEYITKANIGWRINNTVKWKGIGVNPKTLLAMGIKPYQLIRNAGESSIPAYSGYPQVSLSNINGFPALNSFNGKWLHC